MARGKTNAKKSLDNFSSRYCGSNSFQRRKCRTSPGLVWGLQASRLSYLSYFLVTFLLPLGKSWKAGVTTEMVTSVGKGNAHPCSQAGESLFMPGEPAKLPQLKPFPSGGAENVAWGRGEGPRDRDTRRRLTARGVPACGLPRNRSHRDGAEGGFLSTPLQLKHKMCETNTSSPPPLSSQGWLWSCPESSPAVLAALAWELCVAEPRQLTAEVSLT